MAEVGPTRVDSTINTECILDYRLNAVGGASDAPWYNTNTYENSWVTKMDDDIPKVEPVWHSEKHVTAQVAQKKGAP